jgi:hypothetical protein
MRHECFTSPSVLDEAGAGDSVAAAERLAALVSLPLIPITLAAFELAELLLIGGALPQKARVDASHVAIAATKWNAISGDMELPSSGKCDAAGEDCAGMHRQRLASADHLHAD